MTLILFALALAAAPAPDAGACSLQQPGACQDVRDLTQDPGFQEALKAFLGQRRSGYLVRNGRAYDEALMVLGGPAEPAQKLGDDDLFTACRDQSCDERGAAVLEPDGQVLAVAILHSECNKAFPARDCFLRDTLSIFVRPWGSKAVIDGLSDWARNRIAAGAAAPGAPTLRLERVETIAVSGKAAPVAAQAPAKPRPQAAQGDRPEAAAPPSAGDPVIPSPAAEPPPARVEAPPAAQASAPDLPAAPPPAQVRAAQAQVAQAPTTATPTLPAPPAKPTSLSPAEVYAARARFILPPLPPPPLSTRPPAAPAVTPIPKPKPPKPKMEWWQWHWTPYD